MVKNMNLYIKLTFHIVDGVPLIVHMEVGDCH
jgi:hypothetical protein